MSQPIQKNNKKRKKLRMNKNMGWTRINFVNMHAVHTMVCSVVTTNPKKQQKKEKIKNEQKHGMDKD
jgi:hypothetical protein